MSTDNEAGDVHVEVYVRSLSTHGSASRATLGRLAELEQRGLVDAHELVVWGERAPASPECAETATGADIADLVATFREWARRNDLTLAPAMRPRTVDSRLTGVHYEEVRLPELLVATYHGRDLVGVAPHERNGEVCSVRLYLDRLPDPTERAEFVPVDGVRTETETRRTVGVVDASNEGDSDRRSRPEGDTTGGADTDFDDGFGKPPTL